MKDKIYECEVKRQYLINGVREWRWKRAPVTEVQKGEEVRCYECHIKMRLHRQRVSSGPQDHVEHFFRADSEKCPLGFYYLKK